MAVYTEVPEDELARFLSGYGVGTLTSCKGIAEGVENTNYLVDTTGGRFILTLYERRVKASDLPFFLGLMEHLAGRGIACPLPVKARNGAALRRLAGRPAVIVTFLDGLWPRRIEPYHCAELGTALARMHEAGLDFSMSRPNNLSLQGWRALVAETEGAADTVAAGLAAVCSNSVMAVVTWRSSISASASMLRTLGAS